MNKDEAYEIWNSVLSGEDTIFAFASACEKIGMEKIAKYFESIGDRECDSCAKAIRNYLTHIA